MPSCIEKLKGGWRSRTNLPLVLLLLALGTLFLFGNDRGHFHRPGHHDWLSSKYLTLAENLSPEHNFTRFHRLHPHQNGNLDFGVLYHRFPIGGYALIKLAILPFGDDLSAKIHAGRMLMLWFFAAAAVLAHLALSRIAGSQWIACTATGLAFSSHFCLYYSDMIATEGAMELFAVMLVFHGLTLFVQEGRFRQLLAKTCIALLLGWHVYALLLPFIVFSLASEVIRAAPQLAQAAPLDRMKRIVGLLFLSRPVALGAVALAFGLLSLSFNMASEWFALGGAKPITELPTFNSMLRRMGQEQSPDLPARLAWPHFLENQLQILGGMMLPYALPGYASAMQLEMVLRMHPNLPTAFADLFTVGMAALAACLVGLLFARRKILLASLALSGFFWALPMRHSVAFHDFEGLFYIGVPLTLFALVLLYLRRLSGERLMARLAAAALLVFCFSNFQMSLVGNDADEAHFQAETLADFQAIRARTSQGDAIGVMTKELDPLKAVGMVRHALDYYLTQRAILVGHLSEFALDQERLKALDFIVTNWREPGAATLTPNNQRFFLYNRAAYFGPPDIPLASLLAQSNFNVYLAGNALIYLRSPCKEADTTARFLLHVFPTDPADLPEDRRRHRFDNLDFTFNRHGDHTETGEATSCTAAIDLPNYGIARIRTGQFDEQGPIWWEEFPMPK